MHSMMRWSVKYVFKRTELVDEFGVYPELINEIESMHQCEHPRGKTGEHDGCIKDPMCDSAKPTLPASHTQIEMMARMMDDMKIPEKARLMADPVKPVINKIVDKEQDHPGPPFVSWKFKGSESVKK